MTYGARWTYTTGVVEEAGGTVNSVPFLKRNRILIIPPGADLGYFATGPAPDGTYKPGKYTWVHEPTEPPYEWRIGEGLVGFPVATRTSEIFILDAGA